MFENTNKWIDEQAEQLKKYPDIEKLFRNCFKSTMDTTTECLADGTTFVFTGDLPAMWLRDSSAQVSHYLHLCEVDPDMKQVVKGLIKRQFHYILLDPYANAFNKEANGHGHQDDLTEMSKWVWERKYEIDSLCYPIWLTYHYYQKTQDETILDETFIKVVETIIKTWEVEQHHDTKSSYQFDRLNPWSEVDTLKNNGKGTEVGYTGMTWSGFRPSDDACAYHYLIPANQFAVLSLKQIIELLGKQYQSLVKRANQLKEAIEQGIRTYGIFNHPTFGEMYAYETDGLGHYCLMDDANVPSLLSLPYLGYCDINDRLYQNTRSYILSEANPFFFKGSIAQGIGSPHTPKNYIWHIALTMQALTTNEDQEIANCLSMLLRSHANTFVMHEGFNASNPNEYTREWFAWANSLFAVLIIKLLPRMDEIMKLI